MTIGRNNYLPWFYDTSSFSASCSWDSESLQDSLDTVENMLGNETFVKVSQGLQICQQAKQCYGFVCSS